MKPGDIREQNINGTIFRYRVINVIGDFRGKTWLKVENIETKHRMIICETDLK